MRKEFNWEEFKTKPILVHCKNTKEIQDFENQCKVQGLKLVGEGLNKTLDNGYLVLDDDMSGFDKGDRVYCNRFKYFDYWIYQIVEWSDYMEQENKEEKTYMEQVAEMFNKKIDETFTINEFPKLFKFTKTAFLCKFLGKWTNCPENLLKLISGEYTIYNKNIIHSNDKFNIEFKVNKIKVECEGIFAILESNYCEEKIKINIKDLNKLQRV